MNIPLKKKKYFRNKQIKFVKTLCGVIDKTVNQTHY